MFGVDSFTTPKLEAPSVYGVTYLYDRPSEGLAVGDAALHLYPTQYLRFELFAKLGSDNYRADNTTGDTPWKYLGGRPTLIFDVGWFKLRLAGEYQKRTATTQTLDPGAGQKHDPVPERVQKGVGGSIQFVIDPVLEFGVNAAIGKQEDVDAFARPVLENSFTTKSVGGFANVRVIDGLLAGGGVNWTTQTDTFLAASSTLNDFTSHLQCFGAVQYRPLGQLYIKLSSDMRVRASCPAIWPSPSGRTPCTAAASDCCTSTDPLSPPDGHSANTKVAARANFQTTSLLCSQLGP
jgi:hypothetical protein